MTQDAKFKSGAVRSGDTDSFDYTSIPLLGLVAVARTAAEGAEKYGRLNYQLGMPSHTYINHAMHHLTLFGLGDREQPHLAHAIWNLMAAQQAEILDPEAQAPHNVGPGATLTEANRKLLNDGKAALKARREAGEFKDSGKWNLASLPDVVRLLKQRARSASVNSLGLDGDMTAGQFEDAMIAHLEALIPKVEPTKEKAVIYLDDSQEIVDRMMGRRGLSVDARLVENMMDLLRREGDYSVEEIELAARAITANAIEESKRLQAELIESGQRLHDADQAAEAACRDWDSLAQQWNPPTD